MQKERQFVVLVEAGRTLRGIGVLLSCDWTNSQKAIADAERLNQLAYRIGILGKVLAAPLSKDLLTLSAGIKNDLCQCWLPASWAQQDGNTAEATDICGQHFNDVYDHWNHRIAQSEAAAMAEAQLLGPQELDAVEGAIGMAANVFFKLSETKLNELVSSWVPVARKKITRADLAKRSSQQTVTRRINDGSLPEPQLPPGKKNGWFWYEDELAGIDLDSL